MMAVTQNSVGVTAPKTKAKKRYLKAKKDRRKKRKSVVVSLENSLDQDVGTEEDGKGTDEEHETQETSAQTVEPLEIKTSMKEDARPKKRRKIAKPEHVDAHESGEPLADTVVEERSSPKKKPERPPPPIPAALPSFPAPIRPDAPSRAALALQGLDKALIEAELVEPQKVLPILEGDDIEDTTGLSQRMGKRLRELSITELFAVQTAVIPLLLSNPHQRQLYLPYGPPRDLCVSAPTGSGKTLAYVVPIVEILSTRTVTRLRALVVLPTRDLVLQVRETFEAVSKGRGLKIGTATGQHSFAHEQTQIVADRSNLLQGGSSKVDILICTPGRLIDHLAGTPNFSLQHLRFLARTHLRCNFNANKRSQVIDEADRLLAQSFQDWLTQVLTATRPSAISDTLLSATSLPLGIPVADALAPAYHHLLHDILHIHTDLDERKESSCQKLLFSATLTRDPAKISALRLNNPKYLVVQASTEKATQEDGVLDLVMEKFTMPATLSEHMVICDSSQKPLLLFYLIHKHGITNALVFTKSAESTNRLVRLFGFFETIWTSQSGEDYQPKVSQAYSSDLGASDRKSILERFKNQEINILVCSDLISRGIDISHVSHVVSYDAPVDMRKYVHRVGRTARAGRAGDAWTLVEEQEARYFKTMLKSGDHLDAVKRLRVSEKDVAPLVPVYERALLQLKDVYSR